MQDEARPIFQLAYKQFGGQGAFDPIGRKRKYKNYPHVAQWRMRVKHI